MEYVGAIVGIIVLVGVVLLVKHKLNNKNSHSTGSYKGPGGRSGGGQNQR